MRERESTKYEASKREKYMTKIQKLQEIKINNKNKTDTSDFLFYNC